MKRVAVRIKYTSACLAQIGNEDGTYYRFPRDSDAKVIIMQSWIRAALRTAINHIIELPEAKNLPVKDLSSLHRRLFLETTTVASDDTWQMNTADGRSVTYDCLRPGTIVTLMFLIPYGINTKHFLRALTHVGKFVGLSPRHASDGFGRFEVLGYKTEDKEDAPPKEK